jgi:hypothetical protein
LKNIFQDEPVPRFPNWLYFASFSTTLGAAMTPQPKKSSLERRSAVATVHVDAGKSAQPKKSSLAESYLRFLKLTQAIESLPSSPDIDANEEALLNALSMHWHAGKPLAVREAMTLDTLGSPSTLHRRISRLKALGLIEDKSSPGNLRIKLLVPTQKTVSYFDKLGATLGKSVK